MLSAKLPDDFLQQKRQVPIMWVANNCESNTGRERYLQELMKYIPVDSFGKCLHTKVQINRKKSLIDRILIMTWRNHILKA